MRKVNQVKLLSNVTAVGAGAAVRLDTGCRAATFQAVGATTSGVGTAAVEVQVSNDGVNWITDGTINLTLSTTSSSAGAVMDEAWVFVRGNIPAGGITGTGASVSLIMGS